MHLFKYFQTKEDEKSYRRCPNTVCGIKKLAILPLLLSLLLLMMRMMMMMILHLFTERIDYLNTKIYLFLRTQCNLPVPPKLTISSTPTKVNNLIKLYCYSLHFTINTNVPCHLTCQQWFFLLLLTRHLSSLLLSVLNLLKHIQNNISTKLMSFIRSRDTISSQLIEVEFPTEMKFLDNHISELPKKISFQLDHPPQ